MTLHRFSMEEADVVSYNTSMNACAKSAQWQTVLHLFEEMRESTILPDVLSYSALLICTPRWQSALALLEQMLNENEKPDLPCLKAILSSCQSSSHWMETLQFLTLMKSHSLALEIASYNLAINEFLSPFTTAPS
eukprot:symbB.v1.2.016829.t1/scaffold1294.1/size126307/4